MMINSEVQLNQYGTNAKIKGHILDKATMKSLGFFENYYEGTDYEQYSEYWYVDKILDSTFEISFNIAIYKDTEVVRIDILDEDFCQPYDYQLILSKIPTSKLDLLIRDKVEEIMNKLQSAGVISGHTVGEYI